MSAVDFFRSFERNVSENIRVAAIARVNRYDEIRRRADVTPRGLPMIQGAPVLHGVSLEPGDTVLIVFVDTALDGSSSERHRIEDAVVVGKVSV